MEQEKIFNQAVHEILKLGPAHHETLKSRFKDNPHYDFLFQEAFHNFIQSKRSQQQQQSMVSVPRNPGPLLPNEPQVRPEPAALPSNLGPPPNLPLPPHHFQHTAEQSTGDPANRRSILERPPSFMQVSPMPKSGFQQHNNVVQGGMHTQGNMNPFAPQNIVHNQQGNSGPAAPYGGAALLPQPTSGPSMQMGILPLPLNLPQETGKLPNYFLVQPPFEQIYEVLKSQNKRRPYTPVPAQALHPVQVRRGDEFILRKVQEFLLATAPKEKPAPPSHNTAPTNPPLQNTPTTAHTFSSSSHPSSSSSTPSTHPSSSASTSSSMTSPPSSNPFPASTPTLPPTTNPPNPPSTTATTTTTPTTTNTTNTNKPLTLPSSITVPTNTLTNVAQDIIQTTGYSHHALASGLNAAAQVVEDPFEAFRLSRAATYHSKINTRLTKGLPNDGIQRCYACGQPGHFARDCKG